MNWEIFFFCSEGKEKKVSQNSDLGSVGPVPDTPLSSGVNGVNMEEGGKGDLASQGALPPAANCWAHLLEETALWWSRLKPVIVAPDTSIFYEKKLASSGNKKHLITRKTLQITACSLILFWMRTFV